MADLRPGRDGEPLAAGEWVLRLAVLSMDADEGGRASAAAFELSSADRQSATPRLSVWADALTTQVQAWELMGADLRYRLVLRLGVDEIRALRPAPDSPDVPGLDVVWDPLVALNEQGEPVPDSRLGAEGHAGITGLARGGRVNRLHTKSLRRQLALIADVSALELPARDKEDRGT